ncbi:EF-hand calcium-binding domain-containing protein 11 [Holothuria leucospilota]|uniref:EF-hand calcium-binding domain-containing protein 11 n=1 Tax=Holothuria leucospilota TaxID=206669 RepID=A0A9Q1CGX3_HOLLE|nr:EF-hand calcium-binding domain-containing protein 11 [Holothuria leucospilota]
MRKKIAAVDKDEEIREIFRAFDRQSKGFITIEDLHHVASTVSPHLPKHRLIAAFQELDGDKDGRISFRDFEFLMKYGVEDDL